MRGRLVRAAAALGVALGLTSAVGRMPSAPAAPGPVVAAAPARSTVAPAVSVVLDDLSPTIARPGQDVTVRATITNTTARQTDSIVVRALVGGSPVRGRSSLSAWLHSAQPRSLATSVVASQEVAALAPKASTTVTLTLPARSLARSAPFGAYPLAVEATSGGERAGIVRSVLPWVSSNQEYEPLRLAWVAPLTLPADPELSAGTASAVGGAWQRTVGPQGTLQQRLDAASGTPVTWMVDPAVITPPTRVGGMVTATPETTGATSSTATGSSAATPDRTAATPTTSASTGTAPAAPADDTAALAAAGKDAAALARRLAALGDEQPVWELPAGDPDTAALLGADVAAALRPVVWPQGDSPLDKALGRPVTDTVAWPADGRWPAGATTAWSSLTGAAKPSAALVSSTAIAGRGTTPEPAQRSTEGLPLLTYDGELSTITDGSRTSSDSQLVQEFLGQSLTLLGELPGTRRSALVAVPRSTAMSGPALRRLWAATGSAPWLRQVETTSILGEGARTSTPTSDTHSATSPLDRDRVDQLEHDLATAQGLGAILPADHALESSWTAGVRDLTSARWRGRSGQWQQLHRALEHSLEAVRQGVQVRPSTINFFADTGMVQITVNNTLPYAVHDVRLDLEPGSTKLRVDQPTKTLSIAAGSRTTTQVRVTALGAGTVPVKARLSTPDQLVLASPSTVEMKVRPTSVWVFALIAGIVGAILVLGLARSLRRGPTRAQRELGDTNAVAEAVLGHERPTKDSS